MGEAQTPTLVLSPRFSADSNHLWKAAVTRGWNIHRALRLQGPEDRTGCLVYGERYFCDVLADRLGLGLLDPPDDWLTRLPQEFVKRDVSFMTVRELPSVTERRFIKPANDKLFEASVYGCGKDVPVRYVDPKCPVLISEVVDFSIEIRFYILDRQILTGDFYILKAEREPEDFIPEAKAWVKPLLESPSLNLPSAVVVDVGFIEDRGWAVIEANQVYSSGLYGETDHIKVLDIVQRAAGPLERVRPEDHPFLRRSV